jgi:hypothetical protein
MGEAENELRDVPRRIARERVPTMGVDLIPSVDACGRPPARQIRSFSHILTRSAKELARILCMT